MNPTPSAVLPRPWLPVVVATYVALAVLFVGIAVVQYGLVALSWHYMEIAPEYARFQIPMLIPTLGFCLCGEVGIVATTVLVARVRAGHILESGAVRWVDVLVVSVTVAGVFVGAFAVLLRVADAVPPGAVLFVVIGGLAVLVIVLLLLVLRSLLRHAIILRSELDEVV